MAKVSLMEIVLSSFAHRSSRIKKFMVLRPCRGVAQATAKCCTAKEGRQEALDAAQMGLCVRMMSPWLVGDAISGFILCESIDLVKGRRCISRDGVFEHEHRKNALNRVQVGNPGVSKP